MKIVRKEYGYGGIFAIGVTKIGEIVFSKDKNIKSFQITSTTRIIKNPPVKDALSSPIKIFFDPSLSCLLNCPFCLAAAPLLRKNKQKIPSISKENIRKINQQIIEAGVLQVKIGGGEPFIYPYFWETLNQLGEAGIVLSTSTSGITLNNSKLLSKKQIEILKKNNVKISISVDGEPAYHNKIRGKPNLLETALSGIKRLLKYGFDPKKIHLRATITNEKDSMSQIDYLNKLSLSLNTYLRIRLALPSGSATINKTAIIYPTKEFWLFYEKLRSYVEKNPFINVEEIVRFDKSPYLKTGLDCGAGTRSAFIDAYGNFMPCGFIDEYFFPPYHNLFTEKVSLLELWQNGEAFKAVRLYLKQESKKNPCARCEFIHSCQGGCPAVRLNINLNSDPRCPKKKRVYLPINIKKNKNNQEITFVKLTSSSLLLYQSPNNKKIYIVCIGKIKNKRLILRIPEEEMNAGADKNLFDTSIRKIKEELKIDLDKLQFVSAKKTFLIINNKKIKTKNKNNIYLKNLKEHLDSQKKPLAIIINNDSLKNNLITIYNFFVKIKPSSKVKDNFIVLIPKESLQTITKIKTITELKKKGGIFNKKAINPTLSISFLENIIYLKNIYAN